MTDKSGPAFPCSNEQYTHGNPQSGDAHSGMSLRDWFAGQALAGMSASADWYDRPWSRIAEEAYMAADALLTARDAQ